MHFLFPVLPVAKVLHGPLAATFTCQKFNIGLWSVKSSMIRHESPLQSLRQTRRPAHVIMIDIVSSVLLRMLDNVKNTGYCHLLVAPDLLRQRCSPDHGDFWQLLFNGTQRGNCWRIAPYQNSITSLVGLL
jgi:hypothetical protein